MRRWARIGQLFGSVLIVLTLNDVKATSEEELLPPQDVVDAEQARIETIARISAPTIAVFGPGGEGGGGSGVLITPDGYALTNFHVAKPSGDYMTCGLSDGELYDAVVVGLDPTGDVALIKLLGRDDFPAAPMGGSDRLEVGEWCYVVGNPFLLATDFQPTVTYGIVSGVHRYQYPAGTLLEYTDCIQTDAAINPGNSGGPLFNAAGELVGINGRGSFEKRGRVNVGVGYAISINQIKKFMGYLRSGRIVDHATLGATASSDENGRVVITNILESTDAYRRGLRFDDEIVSVDGRSIHSVNSLKNVIGTYPRGWRIPVVFRRGEQEQTILVRLAGVHTYEQLYQMVESPGQLPQLPPEEPPTPEKPEKHKDRPKIPRRSAKHRAKNPPPHVAKLLEKRRGYANYVFNRQHVDRVCDMLRDGFEDPKIGKTWVLRGKLKNRTFTLTLADQYAEASFRDELARIDMSKELSEQLAPNGSGGLLLALQMWKRLLVLGPKEFGEVFYLGTAPVPGRTVLADVLVGIHDALETRFYVEPDTGQLLLIEMYPTIQTDPAEIYVLQTEVRNGRQLPVRMEVRHGDSVFGVLETNDVQLVGSEDEA